MDFNAIISSIAASLGIAQTLNTLKNENDRATAVAELTRSIAETQAQLLQTMNECFKLTNENQELRKQLGKKQCFDRYTLCPTSTGSMVLALKQEFVSLEEPMHYICVNCREDGILSPLHLTKKQEHYCTRKGCEFGHEHFEKKHVGPL